MRLTRRLRRFCGGVAVAGTGIPSTLGRAPKSKRDFSSIVVCDTRANFKLPSPWSASRRWLILKSFSKRASKGQSVLYTRRPSNIICHLQPACERIWTWYLWTCIAYVSSLPALSPVPQPCWILYTLSWSYRVSSLRYLGYTDLTMRKRLGQELKLLENLEATLHELGECLS